ncbi:hypothetical protein Rsub_05613 [Raphidocelis subcapitata]|uniref:Uncharacterized protein n=1 Tax=Raphidocelis subcapitata TaxID=307507 RepID=A0A2V0NXQ4_9CHLO|nr:hypothetical protein Rsub_05613 [Raphidocelis subcapitata]|eukprot:GBF92411.1 hypothetical protein Rsub_05613 [Raphidocelis subcapitata]
MRIRARTLAAAAALALAAVALQAAPALAARAAVAAAVPRPAAAVAAPPPSCFDPARPPAGLPAGEAAAAAALAAVVAPVPAGALPDARPPQPWPFRAPGDRGVSAPPPAIDPSTRVLRVTSRVWLPRVTAAALRWWLEMPFSVGGEPVRYAYPDGSGRTYPKALMWHPLDYVSIQTEKGQDERTLVWRVTTLIGADRPFLRRSATGAAAPPQLTLPLSARVSDDGASFELRAPPLPGSGSAAPAARVLVAWVEKTAPPPPPPAPPAGAAGANADAEEDAGGAFAPIAGLEVSITNEIGSEAYPPSVNALLACALARGAGGSPHAGAAALQLHDIEAWGNLAQFLPAVYERYA